MFKKSLEEIRQEKEARDYFRQNNNEIANAKDYLLTLLVSIGVTIVGGMLIYLIVQAIHITSAYFYIIIGSLIVSAIAKVINKSTLPIKILAVLGYIIGMVIVTMIEIYMVVPLDVVELFTYAIQFLLTGDLVSSLFVLAGGVITFLGIK